jgi:hypothetical protein
MGQISLSEVLTPRSLVGGYHRFGRKYHSLLQGEVRHPEDQDTKGFYLLNTK